MADEVADLAVEEFGRLYRTDVPDAGQDDQPGSWDPGLEGVRYVQRGAHIPVAVHQESWHVHRGK